MTSGYEKVYGNSTDGWGITMLYIIAFSIGIMALVWFIQFIYSEKHDTVIERTDYVTVEKRSSELIDDVNCVKQTGKPAIVEREYKIVSRFGKEESREIVKERIIQEAQEEHKIVGTMKRQHGYCSVEGSYRKRYAQCYEDYSQKSKKLAEERAHICNTSPYNESGCTDTFYSSVNTDAKTCAELDFDSL